MLVYFLTLLVIKLRGFSCHMSKCYDKGGDAHAFYERYWLGLFHVSQGCLVADDRMDPTEIVKFMQK